MWFFENFENFEGEKKLFPRTNFFKFHQWPTGANSYQKNTVGGLHNRFLEIDFFGFLGEKKEIFENLEGEKNIFPAYDFFLISPVTYWGQ